MAHACLLGGKPSSAEACLTAAAAGVVELSQAVNIISDQVELQGEAQLALQRSRCFLQCMPQVMVPFVWHGCGLQFARQPVGWLLVPGASPRMACCGLAGLHVSLLVVQVMIVYCPAGRLLLVVVGSFHRHGSAGGWRPLGVLHNHLHGRWVSLADTAGW